jgi:NAD-dependent dihydropyrimidine dehydrogenase PreA subunit
MFGLRYIEKVNTLALDTERCTGCGMCLEVCPHGVFRLEQRKAVLADRGACMECGACRRNCPAEALSVRSGVGCAAGVISGWMRGTEPTCACGADDADGPSCC